MPATASHFLARLRWRWTLHRALDAMLAALMLAAVGALVAAFTWHISVNAVCLLFVAASTVGAGLGLLRRPTLLQAAELADRELHLHELLGTWVRMSKSAHDSFAAMISSGADAACAGYRSERLAIPHHAAAVRGAAILLAAIAMNVVWLNQTQISRPLAQRSESPVASIVPITVASTGNSLAASIRTTPKVTEDSQESCAREYNLSGEAAPHRLADRDAAGGAVAQTVDHHADPLAPAPGEFRPSGTLNAAVDTLAPQATATNSASADRAVVPLAEGGGYSAAAAPQYRDLIHAYFSGPTR